MYTRHSGVNGEPEPDPAASSAHTDDSRFQPQHQENARYSVPPERTFSACDESDHRRGWTLSMVNAFVSQISIIAAGFLLLFCLAPNSLRADDLMESFGQHCLDCHSGSEAEGNFDFDKKLQGGAFDATLVFENIATKKMPPAAAEALTDEERQEMLTWLAEQQPESKPIPFRRISRHEFVHSVNDLLGTNLDLSGRIPEDRGTRSFDSDRRIGLSREMLGSYFAVADEMLEHALPADGFINEHTWVTNKLIDSHKTYNIYVRDYKDGVLFSWTRANNGNSYSFFYDNFNPPVEGWYELTFDAAKVGDLKSDVSIQVHAGKYYYADDRPQPQRLLDVISVDNEKVAPQTIRVFLRPGENVSVHCFHKDNFREKNPKRGAYIRALTARGPLQDAWPPSRYGMLFEDLPVKTTGNPKLERETEPGAARRFAQASGYQSNLTKIGGSITVSSFQVGMKKEKMQDGSNRTFWHTRFKPTLAVPPHFVILHNPNRHAIAGLSYATWSGGNGNGQIEKFEVYASKDGRDWGKSIASGDLEKRLASEQPIPFSVATNAPFLKFVATQSFSIDGRSLASIGKLDVVVSLDERLPKSQVSIASDRINDLRKVIRRFAERAFSSMLSDSELRPYFDVATATFQRDGNFIEAAKTGFKAVICSHRFLMAPGEHSSEQLSRNAMLARAIWMSVPDDQTSESNLPLRDQVAGMLADRRSDRMIQSLCNQWLNLRFWNNVSPSLKLYPRYDDLLDFYLPLETEVYLAHLISENRPVSELIDSDYSFLNQRLANHYGIDAVTGQQLRKVSFGPDVPRGGLLTMGSVLKVTTDGFATSPILRGAWISKNIVGTPVSPPPETVKAIDSDHGDEAASLRDQIDQHKNSDACYACHKSIDPYGFALESFDATGQWRTKYSTELPHRGTFTFRLQGYSKKTSDIVVAGKINDQEFENVFGLKMLLVSDERKIAYNFAKNFFEYANGYQPILKQRLDLLEMIDPKNCRMRDLVTDVLVYSIGGNTDQAGKGMDAME
jgi:mono/diheme cytochrome c family protein